MGWDGGDGGARGSPNKATDHLGVCLAPLGEEEAVVRRGLSPPSKAGGGPSGCEV